MSDVILPTGFNLSFCPRCDYSLTGLPTARKCPECGQDYDQTFLVRRATQIDWGDERPGQFNSSILWNIFSLLLLLTFLAAGTRSIVMDVLSASLALHLFVEVLVWLKSRRRSNVIWFHPLGVGKQQAIDPGSGTARAVRFARVTDVCGFIGSIGLMTAMRSDSGGLILFVVALTVASIHYVYHLGKRRRFVLPPRGLRPGLLGWQHFEEILWQPEGNGNYRLTMVENAKKSASPLIDVGLTVLPDDAGFISDKIEAWTGARFRALPLNPGNAKLNRTARVVGNVLRKHVIRPNSNPKSTS